MSTCNYCGTEITFSDLIVSERSGKKIPLDLNEEPHRCNVWASEHRKYYSCRNGCGSQIYFDKKQKSKNDKWVPIDKDTGSPHKCQDLDFDI